MHAGSSDAQTIDLSENLFYKHIIYRFISITYQKISPIGAHLMLQNGLGIYRRVSLVGGPNHSTSLLFPCWRTPLLADLTVLAVMVKNHVFSVFLSNSVRTPLIRFRLKNKLYGVVAVVTSYTSSSQRALHILTMISSSIPRVGGAIGPGQHKKS